MEQRKRHHKEKRIDDNVKKQRLDEQASSSGTKRKRTHQRELSSGSPSKRCKSGNNDTRITANVNFMNPVELRELIDARLGHQVSSLVKNPFLLEYLNSPKIDLISVLTMLKLLTNTLFCECETLRKKAQKEVIPQLIKNVGFLQAVRYHLLCVPARADILERVGSDLFRFISQLCKLFDLIISPGVNIEACNVLPVDTLWGTTRQLALQEIRYQALHAQAIKILEARDHMRQLHYDATQRDKMCSFHDGIVLPFKKELNQKTLPLSLEKNIVHGSYCDVQHYLDIQYNLLREDFIHPLRCAYNEIELSEMDDEEGEGAMYIYSVEIKPQDSETTEVEVFFQLPINVHVCWDRSKRLSYGNLLCFINNTDKTNVVIWFATVAERNVKDLENGILSVDIQSNVDIMRQPSKPYRMIESPGFYAAYSPVLRHLYALKENPELLRFPKYIVRVEGDIDCPSYVSKENGYVLSLHNVLCCMDHVLGEMCPYYNSVNIMDEEVWKSVETPELNESQKKALHCALTKELAIIQGPPGTGKTYTGLKIVQTLLENRTSWDGDREATIVLVCYTNHALDQFLEGIIKMRYLPKSTKIRRVGGRSKSELLKEYNIKNYVLKLLRSLNVFGFWRGSNAKVKKTMIAIKELQNCEFKPHRVKEYVRLIGTEFRVNLDALEFSFLVEYNLDEFADWLGLVPQQDAVEYVTVDNDRKMDDDEERIMKEYGEKQLCYFFKQLSKVEPLTHVRAREIACCEPAEIEPHVRLQLFKYCILSRREIMEETLKQGIKGEKEYELQRKLAMFQCLKEADVVGMTTTSAASNNDLLSKINAKIVIVEEAAEVLEAHIVSSLSKKTEHLILIGDHKQLRPKTNDHKLACEYKLDISLFQRLIDNGLPHVTLEYQHRMRPEISALVSAHIYSNSVKDSESVKNYPPIAGMKHSVFFIDHREPESNNIDLKSKVNAHEAKFLARLCKYILQQQVYSETQITVLTPYTGQMFFLRDEFMKVELPSVKITTIDSYQGEENDIVLLSLVRSEKPGFVVDECRVCVALSRAKHGLFVIGCFSKIFIRRSRLWASVVSQLCQQERYGNCLPLECQAHKTLTHVTKLEDFDNVHDGGCSQPCNSRLACRHICPYNCHPNAKIEHKKMKCEERCPKFCDQGHQCKKKCSECNGTCLCDELVSKTISKCGHQQPVPCHLNPLEHICQENCNEILSCGHKCGKKCGEKHTVDCQVLVEKVCEKQHKGKAECYMTNEAYSRRCAIPCKEILMCEHLCQGTCGGCRQGRLHKPCKEKCNRILNCGHECSSTCSQNCPPCKKKCPVVCFHGPCDHTCWRTCLPCPHTCTRTCEHQKCTRLCGELCNIPPCDQPCKLSLPCTHPCMGLCGEIPCPKVCRICNKDNFNKKVPLIFGTEDLSDNPNMRIIMLDCGDMFEVWSLDKYYNQAEEEIKIQWIQCMLCKKPVMKVNRYKHLHIATIKRLNEVKEKEFVMSKDERSEMITKLNDYLKLTKLTKNPKKILDGLRRASDRALQDEYTVFHAEHSMRDIFKDFCDNSPTMSSCSGATTEYAEELQTLKKQREDFINKLERYRQTNLTHQVIHDIQAEQHRIQMLVFVISIQLKINCYNIEVSMDEKTQLDDMFKRYRTGYNQACILKMTTAEYESNVSYLKNLERKYHQLSGITQEEKEMIIKTLTTKPGSWYYCPNGHVYNIGECGGAMVESKCPECKATIGGSRHRLHSDNTHAADFDDSSHSAWPITDNMGDYEL